MFKKCQKKQYNVHVCMPPIGTVCINKLEQYDSAVAVANVTTSKALLFLPDEIQKNPALAQVLQTLLQQGKAYITSQERPFIIAGVIGELYTCRAISLQNGYTWSDGTVINDQTIAPKLKNNILDWTVISTITTAQELYANFVPVSNQGVITSTQGYQMAYNMPGINHGKGDFIVANNPQGMGDLKVVNGIVFAHTYNNRGFTDYLVDTKAIPSVTIADLPPITTDTSKVLQTAKRRTVKVGVISTQINAWANNYKEQLRLFFSKQSAESLIDVAKKYAAYNLIGKMFKDVDAKKYKNLKDLSEAEVSQTLTANDAILYKNIVAGVLADKILPGTEVSYTGADEDGRSKVLEVAQDLDSYAQGIRLINLDNMTLEQKQQIIMQCLNEAPCYIVQNGTKEITSFLCTRSNDVISQYYDKNTYTALKILSLYSTAANVHERGYEITSKKSSAVPVQSLALRVAYREKKDKFEVSSTSYSVKPEEVLVIGVLQGLSQGWSAGFQKQLGEMFADPNKLIKMDFDYNKYRAIYTALTSNLSDLSIHKICPEMMLNPEDPADQTFDAYYTLKALSYVDYKKYSTAREEANFSKYWRKEQGN